MAPIATQVTGARSNYVVGGNLLHAKGSWSSNLRAPKSGMPVVKDLRLIDAKMQGMAGDLETLQAILGVADDY